MRSPPHPDASNLIWHPHCRLGRDGGDGLNATTTTTPTFLHMQCPRDGWRPCSPPSISSLTWVTDPSQPIPVSGHLAC